MASESGDLLQHPRRNLGNRFRSQAQKFTRLAASDTSREKENMAWALKKGEVKIEEEPQVLRSVL